VLWADVLQAGIMLASLLAVVIKGVLDVGGLDTVWERASLTGRVEFFKLVPNFNNALRVLNTFDFFQRLNLNLADPTPLFKIR